MKIIYATQYAEELARVSETFAYDAKLNQTVLEIIHHVRKNGDQALREYTEEFDEVTLDSIAVSEAEISEAREIVSEKFIQAIQRAHDQIKEYHEKQVEKSWFYEAGEGMMLGQKVTPIESVGLYVPGGTAAYPSSVLMNAVPAKIAGVTDIYMTAPPQEDGKMNPYILIAASIAGVDKIFKVGGAQSIAAFAYGTETMPKVAKIVGPGNAYVAAAKRFVFGEVGIDMIAGPSEICVVADKEANPRYVAADLLSQAEHDVRSRAICITTDQDFAEQLQQEVIEQTKDLERKEIVDQSLADHGRIILVDSLTEAFELVNEIAPEHLQLMVKNPWDMMQKVKNAGAIFLGNHSPEALGDYVAGPNHTLPTNGTATFSSPLGVYDFIKRSSIIQYTEAALAEVSEDIITIARAEGLTAHAKSIEKRQGEDS